MTLAHSEEYLTDERDSWWNADFLELMAKRWELDRYTTIADIGSGRCHWSKLLVKYMKHPSTVYAVDSDDKWAEENAQITSTFKRQHATIKYIKGDATQIPLENNSVDIVTCQTLLIHVKDYKRVLAEMKRIVRPGGLIICVEPNNLINPLVFDKISRDFSIEEIITKVRFELYYDLGKKMSGEGDTSIAEQLPEAFERLGLTDIQAYLSDQVTLEKSRDLEFIAGEHLESAMADEVNILEIEKARSYEYLKMVGEKAIETHKAYWELIQKYNRAKQVVFERGSYVGCAGALMYLVSGVK